MICPDDTIIQVLRWFGWLAVPQSFLLMFVAISYVKRWKKGAEHGDSASTGPRPPA